MALARSPLAPARFPDLPGVAGVRLAACAAGLRYRDRPDLTLIELAPGTTVAGLFTQSLLPGHPVRWCRAILPYGRARALVVNAGQANVMVGAAGDAVVRTEAEAAARLLGARPEEIYIASTGVIGERLDVGAVVARLPELEASLAPGAWELAARAIATTDTFFKGSFARAAIGDAEVTICGLCKGSGMIQPDMATMLAFLFTDAALPAGLLQALLAEANRGSFNAITVDGDTSTSDTVLLFATGQARHPAPARLDDPLLEGFRSALAEVMTDLAKQVVRDGEGAKKLIEVRVAGAVTDGVGEEDRLQHRQLAAGQDRDRGRRCQLGPACHGDRQGGRADRPRADRDPGRRPRDRRGRPPARGLRRGAGGGPSQGPGDPARGGGRQRPGRGHGLDLRSDRGLHRDQRRLPLVGRLAITGLRRR